MRRLAIAATLVVGVLAVSLVLRPSGEAGAQIPAPTVTVVFAIDNSGSMLGSAGSDPTEERILGIRRVLDVLRGFLAERAGGRDVQVGAVSFGYDAALLAPLSSVLDPSLPDRLNSEDRGGTDFAAALCSAWVVATQQIPPSGSGCTIAPDLAGEVSNAPSRAAFERRLVVLITDGSPAPTGAPLQLDGLPGPDNCGAGSFATTDGDEYLCALGDTWRVLNAVAEVELIVIGLDQRDEWFAQSEPYWQRVVGCGRSGEPPCVDSVVRNVDARELADLILRLFPLIDVCEHAAGGRFSCDIPGGLTSVGFQFTGIDSVTRTRLGDGTTTLDSDSADPSLHRSESAHVWLVEAPRGGPWTAESNGPATQQLYVHYEPAEFDGVVEMWTDTGLQLELSARATTDPQSTERQPYYLELRENGVPLDNATVTLQSNGGRGFTLDAAMSRPRFSPNARYELVLYLPLTPMFEVLRLPVDASAPDGLAPDPVCTIDASWQTTGTAPAHELGLRLGFPLLRFRVPADWSVTFSGTGCDHPVEVRASLAGCATCVAEAVDTLPITLTLTPPGGVSTVSRDISWFDRTNGHEDYRSDDVVVRDGLLLRAEPVWGSLLHVASLVLVLVGVSAWSARSPQRAGDDETLVPIDVGIEHRGWSHPIVRLGAFVYRPVPADLERAGGGASRVVMLRYFITGPIVVRGGDSVGGGSSSWWHGVPIAAAGVRLESLRPPEAGSW